MSAFMTRGQLKTRALQRGDFQNTTFIDQSAGGELEQLVDTRLKRLWNLLTELDESYGERGPYYLSTVANQKVYPLPADYFKLNGIYYCADTSATGRRFPLQQFTRSEYGSNANYYNWGPPPIYYRLVGPREIMFDPAPTVSQTNIIEYFYTPVYHPPASDTEVIEQFVIPGWEDYVVDGAAWDMRIKEGLGEEGALAARLADFETKLRSLASNRDRMKPHRIEDVGWAETEPWYSRGWGYWGFYGSW